MDYFTSLPSAIQVTIWWFLSPLTFLSLAANINHASHSIIKQSEADKLYQRLFSDASIKTIHAFKQKSSFLSWRVIFYLIKYKTSNNKQTSPPELTNYYWSSTNHRIVIGDLNHELRDWISCYSPTQYCYNKIIELIWSFLHPGKLPPSLHNRLIPVNYNNSHYFYRRCHNCFIYWEINENYFGVVLNYCPACHQGVAPHFTIFDKEIDLALLQSYIYKQIIYKTLQPSLAVVNIFPHDAATCALCVFQSTDHFRSFLRQEDVWQTILDEANASLSELHYFPLDDTKQDSPLVPDAYYTIDHSDVSSVQNCLEYSSILTDEQKDAWRFQIKCELIQESEIQYKPGEQLDNPRFVQVVGWHFRLTPNRRFGGNFPSEFELSQDCKFWLWKEGTIERVKPRLSAIRYWG